MQIIYKKSPYKQLSFIRKILYKMCGGEEFDEIVGFTTDDSLASLYMSINNKNNNLYTINIKSNKYIYDICKKRFNGLELKSYTDRNGNYIIIKEEDKKDLSNKGVVFYDSTK